ncbi:hypothetical protein J3369_03035 [Alteromonas sp. NFXS44]|uniref:hypothetical protein n=1 Tax=Alteromonas sp. NFXS44 TaxID=2818435 RepID=UPI0032DF0821
MKIVIYGASVTAQKGRTGYFEHLKEILNEKYEVVRLPFGASHLHFAGIAMIQKVLDEKPDFCILDWVTPSASVFPDDTVTRINNILISNKIRPIWILLPRTDDPFSERKSCEQVLDSKSDIVKVFKFQESSWAVEDLSSIIRDVVHTNENGAAKYASFINEVIEEVCNPKINFVEKNKSLRIPKIIACDGTIKEDSPLTIAFSHERGNLSLYSLSLIGPASPILQLDLMGNDRIVQSHFRNVVDPWCYYERTMLINFPSFKNIESGFYKLRISIVDEDPFENVKTLKSISSEDLLENHLDRFLKVDEFIIDGDVKVEGYHYGL